MAYVKVVLVTSKQFKMCRHSAYTHRQNIILRWLFTTFHKKTFVQNQFDFPISTIPIFICSWNNGKPIRFCQPF